MATVPVDPFKLSEMVETERKQFNSTVSRLKKKIHSVENIMYSQPFADSHDDFKQAWNSKLSNILNDDCGISVLTSTRNPKPVYGRQDTVEDEVPTRARTPKTPQQPIQQAPVQKKKKKKNQPTKTDDDLATRKPFGGSKPENETLRVINNYNGANTVYSGKRVLKRLGPQGQGPLPATAVPPWIGPCYYSNTTADKLLYGKPIPGFQSPFKSVGREPKNMSEIKEELAMKKEWSGLFSGPGSVYGSTSIPFSAKASLTDHSECVSEHEDTNVWSKMSGATTLGARQVTNHYKNATTPYIGHKTIRTSSPKRRRKGVLDGEECSTKIDIHKERIFDATVLEEMRAGEENMPDLPDDASLATSVFGGSDDVNSIGTSSSLSTRKRYDTISLLSKSVNFSVFTGFSVDKVTKNFVAKKKRTYEVADYTMGALSCYNESVTEDLKFTDPSRGNPSEAVSVSHSVSQTPTHSPRPEEQAAGGISPRSLHNSLSTVSAFGSDHEGYVPKPKAGKLVQLMSLAPRNTAESIGHVKPKRVTKKDIAAAPGRSTYRRTAITPVPLRPPSPHAVQEQSNASVLSVSTDLSRSYSNLNSEISRSRSNLLSRSSSGFALDKQASFSRQPSALTSQRSMRRQKTAELHNNKSLSRSMSQLTMEDAKALIETGVSVHLGGLLLPGEGVDIDGTAASYSPPETPRIQTPRKEAAVEEEPGDLFELEGEDDDDDEMFLFAEDDGSLESSIASLKRRKKRRKKKKLLEEK